MFRFFYRKTNYIRIRSLPALDDEIRPLLDRIGSGLVERVHDGEIAVDHVVVEHLEGYFARHPGVGGQPVACAPDGETRENRVGTARELAQH